jgi:MauM/NapG family ferredoxin protein
MTSWRERKYSSVTVRTGKLLQNLRRVCQIFFVFLFFYLFFASGSPTLEVSTSAQPFFYFDPLLLVEGLATTGTVKVTFLLALISLAVTFAAGRGFCSWVCPLGTIHHLFSWMSQKQRGASKALRRLPLRVKYVVVATLLVSAFLGTNLTGWLDPFSLLTRSLTVLAPTVDYLIGHSLGSAHAADHSTVPVSFKALVDPETGSFLSGIPAASTQAVLLGSLFVVLVALNFWRRRFFCNTLCPLGALLGIVARWGLLRIRATSRCKSCNSCVKHCTYDGNPGIDYMPSECTTCLNCVVDCPHEAVEVRFGFPAKRERIPIDIGRRKLVGALTFGIVLAAVPKASLQAQRRVRRTFMRPPGARREEDFLAECVRCGQCVQSCPTGFIQPAFLEASFEGLWTPVVSPRAGGCLYECNKCTQVCPTNAIAKLTLHQKRAWKLGTAIVDRGRCLTYVDGFSCTKCEKACPIPSKALRYRDAEVVNSQGRRTDVKQIYVVPDLCTGCGICEYVCPRRDAPGIVVTAEDETRELVFQ